jgi:hypothetical protein
MRTLTDFLLARIAEDEEAARDGAGWDPTGRERSPGRWHRDGLNSVVDEHQRLVVYGDGPAPSDAEAEHIARHDPARVLARCAVDRSIVSLHELVVFHQQAYHDESGNRIETPIDSFVEIASRIQMCRTCGSEGVLDDGPCKTLRTLATQYADHPDYRPEWALAAN